MSLFVELSNSLGLDIFLKLLFSVLKYVLIAGTGYFIFYVWKRRTWFKHKIQEAMPSEKHLRHEIFYSVLSRLIMGGVIVLLTYNLASTQIYFEVSAYGLPYLIASIFGLIFIHDSYFYWAHWLMHRPALYKHVHKVHHHSTNPTPLASFSFHPTEALIEIGIFPLILLLIPLHPIALVSLMLFSMTFNVYGHSGYEMMPRWWVTNPLTKYMNTSTHHNLHHKEFHYNLGLYFNHWDRWMNTLDPDYEKKFYAIKDRAALLDAAEELVVQ